MSAAGDELTVTGRDLLELLLTDYVTQGLSSARRAELEALLEACGRPDDLVAFERAAAAIDLSLSRDLVAQRAGAAGVAMPPWLETRLEILAERYAASEAIGSEGSASEVGWSRTGGPDSEPTVGPRLESFE